MITIDNIMIVA